MEANELNDFAKSFAKDFKANLAGVGNMQANLNALTKKLMDGASREERVAFAKEFKEKNLDAMGNDIANKLKNITDKYGNIAG